MRAIEKVLSNTGCPYAGGLLKEIDPSELTHLGKLKCWGSSCTQFMARLRDGSEVFIKACDEPKDIEKWLRKAAKKVPFAGTSRWPGWTITWTEISWSPASVAL